MHQTAPSYVEEIRSKFHEEVRNLVGGSVL